MSNNNLKLIGSAWCPPLWMKTVPIPDAIGFLKEEYYQTWVNYHIKFLRAYEKQGVNFWAVTTGNEPNNAFIHVKVPTLTWSFQGAVICFFKYFLIC